MAMASSQESKIENRSGRTVFCKSWRPESSPNHVIVLIHGLGEHLGRYEHWVKRFCDAGAAVYALDAHGHGRTSGGRGHTEQFDLIFDDIAQLVARARQDYPKAKIHLYGHSMGGCLVLGTALNRKLDISTMILTGPAIKPGFEPPAWKISLAKFLDRFIPALALGNELDVNEISSDPAVVEAYKKDPLVHNKISVRWFNEWLRTVDQLFANAKSFGMPMLLIHGANDKLTSPSASADLANAIGSNVTFYLWPKSRHEVHNEPFNNEVFNYIWQWLDSK